MTVLWISLAGGFGALSRFVVDGHVKARTYRGFPWGTIIINVTGAFILGVITGLALHHHASSDIKLIAGTGFCGGFTTFSTASFETVRLLEEERYWSATFNAFGTLGLTLLTAAIGLAVVN